MSSVPLAQRHETERAHGQLIHEDPEFVWGQSTKAGRMRIERRAQMVVDACGLRPGMRALELGCGSGNYTELYAKSGADIVAVDLSEDLLAVARKRLPRATFQIAAAETLEGIADDSIDCAIGNAVLHHFDVPLALKAMHRVLKPGGMLCFTEPNMMNPQIALQKNIPPLKRMLGDSPHETAFFRWKIVAQLHRLGFVDAAATPFDFVHPWLPGFLAPPVETLSYILEKIPGLREIAGSLLISARKPR